MSDTLFESQQTPPSVLGASRRALQETTSNSQVYTLEIPDFGHSKAATTSQATVASILEQRRRVQARARGRDAKSIFPLQRVKQYQEYRARQRARQGHDNETDNAAIWPDEIEDAFTEGMSPYLSNSILSELTKLQPFTEFHPLGAENFPCNANLTAEMNSFRHTY
jgi:hypothetical protein